MPDLVDPRRGLTRRRLLEQALAACGCLASGLAPGLAWADDAARAAAAQAAIDAIVGDRAVSDGKLKLTTPAIAENGNTVPIAVEAGGRFTADSWVKAIHVFALANPTPEVASFHFTPASGLAQVATRIRLASTQQVVAIAELSDGRVWRTANEVKVTIGGCGG
ncbi:MAG: thiosulfate oxidation carrier protein SoxY [Gammaproteobacteria bacterium]